MVLHADGAAAAVDVPPHRLDSRRVDAGLADVAIYLYPTKMGQVMAVSDDGMVMPPKSTWFEPKLRSGLFVHTFEGA